MPEILCLSTCGEAHPSVRFRMRPFIADACQRGLDAKIDFVPEGRLKRLSFCAGLPKVRTIVLHRFLPTGLELRLLRRRCQRLVFDLDETLWSQHPSLGECPDRLAAKRRRRLLKACAASAMVIAGTPFLAESVKDVAPNLEFLPTPVDTTVYVPPVCAKRRGRPVVGWLGTTRNQFALPELFEDLAPVAPLVKVKVISGSEYAPPEVFDGTFEQWDEGREVEQLQSLDIGLMPLPDSEYARGKSGLRLLHYMACGVVPVASDVGFNRDIITHGMDGFLAQTPQDFAEFVSLLAREHDLRKQMAVRARQTVCERFDLEKASQNLWKALDVL